MTEAPETLPVRFPKHRERAVAHVTIKDIAKACGVSVSTVSRVLNERPDVSDENRRRVREYIERSHYIPNNSARDLVRTKADAVGLVVRGVGNPFYTDIIRAVEEEVNAAGLALVMRQIDERADEVRCGAEMEREKRLRGLIFLGGQFNYTAHTIRALTVPFVCCAFANSYGTLRPEEYSSVSIADGETAYQAVRYLIEKGHRRIAALVSQTDDGALSQLRYEGYLRALAEGGVGAENALALCAGTYDIRGAYAAMDRALTEGANFNAVFAISDSMALGAMRALYEHGRRVPEDCSVIAIDGLELSDYYVPRLTTLCQPAQEMGRRAARILLELAAGTGANRQEILPTTLRTGGSVRAI